MVSETWTTYARQDKRLNTFHLRSIRRILGMSSQDSDQHWRPVSCWPSHHVHPVETTPAGLVRPRLSHGREPHPKTHPLWRACYGTKKRRPPAPEIHEGCLYQRHEGPLNQHWVLGRPSSWPWQLEKHPPQTAKAGRRKADSDGRRATSSQKASHHHTWSHTQMRPLRQAD